MKAFLSHSSKDKGIYVQTVADRLTQRNCFFDSFSFEEGRLTLEEILRSLGATDLFVFFISENSLSSEWVIRELAAAHPLLKAETIKRVLPIIIDPSITHQDPRIPSWLRDDYNLRLILKPTVAVRRIVQQLREISWLQNPILKERAAVFVGRNDQIKKFEERFGSIDAIAPTCVIASGLRGIGRRALINHCFSKANIWRPGYEPAVIELSSSESIEDFILKASDIGISDTTTAGLALTSMSLPDKVQLAKAVLIDFIAARETLLILDHGGIVLASHSFAPWFSQLIWALKDTHSVSLCIASIFRPAPAELRKIPSIFHIEVPDLEPFERSGLFKRHTELLGLELTKDDLRYFAGLLKGFPAQAEFAARLIKEDGLHAAKAASADIADFNTERVALILRDFEDQPPAFELLCLLAEFDFISLDFLQTIVDDTNATREYLRSFVGRAICERMGVNGEYLRLNDAIRDYISRRRIPVADRFKLRMRASTENFLKTMGTTESDISVVLISLKQGLADGKEIPEAMLIPSHFLKTMKDLYDRHRRYTDVVALADRVLKNQASLDPEILREIRHFLCLALARGKNKRFLQEVQNFKGSDYDFLMGFYYRNIGRYDEALERLQQARQAAPHRAVIRRELVTVYLRLGLYQDALAYAKANHDNDPNNPYHAQAYIRCLIHDAKPTDNRALIGQLLEKLKGAQDTAAHEMYFQAHAEVLAFIDKKIPAALSVIEEAKSIFPESPQIWLSELEILSIFGSVAQFENQFEKIKPKIATDSPWRSAILRFECLLLHKKGLRSQALAFLDAADLPNASKARLRTRLAGT